MSVDVVIVGAGMSGLLTAHALIAAGVEDILVMEGLPHPGGVARTVLRDGYALEPGVGTLPTGLLPFPADLQPVSGPGTRYLHTRGRLLPLTPAVALSPVAAARAKARAVGEVFVPPGAGDETLGEFMERRFGPLGVDLAYIAASGVFAGDPDRLSARASLPRLTGLEESAGSIIRGLWAGRRRPRVHRVVPVPGMSTVADAGARLLGDRFLPGRTVAAAHRSGVWWVVDGSDRIFSRHVVLAIGPHRAGQIVGGEARRLLSRAVTAPVAVLGLGGGSLSTPPGFGALVARDAGLATLGVLFESSYAPHRAPTGHGLVKVIAGGAIRPGVVDWDDHRLAATVCDEVARVIGAELDVSFVEIVRRSIPQYQVGHRGWLDSVESALPPALHLTGWGLRGVGIEQVAADARRVAASIRAEAFA
jgi:oxygen-dependent protoporphyrinogen oxidase